MHLETITDKETIARKTFHERIAMGKGFGSKNSQKSKELYLMLFFHSIIIFAALCFWKELETKVRKTVQGK